VGFAQAPLRAHSVQRRFFRFSIQNPKLLHPVSRMALVGTGKMPKID
jgi:hypothetical protein